MKLSPEFNFRTYLSPTKDVSSPFAVRPGSHSALGNHSSVFCICRFEHKFSICSWLVKFFLGILLTTLLGERKEREKGQCCGSVYIAGLRFSPPILLSVFPFSTWSVRQESLILVLMMLPLFSSVSLGLEHSGLSSSSSVKLKGCDKMITRVLSYL